MPGGCDVVIIGAGPGGSAAGIVCARAGLRCLIIEKRAFPRHRPGESLHPGVAPLFAELGVLQAVERAAQVRHTGVEVNLGGRAVFNAFGSDGRGIWRGFQIQGASLDEILLNRALALGVEVRQPLAVQKIIWSGGRASGVETVEGNFQAPWVVNASGAGSSLSRSPPLVSTPFSRPLFARYGYAEGDLGNAQEYPVLSFGTDGWEWIARLSPTLYQWTRLSTRRETMRGGPPEMLQDLKPADRERAADVTWRRSALLAAPGLVQVGDAAAVLDPASGHGVLRALMTGMMASRLILDVNAGRLNPLPALNAYQDWIGNWWNHDVGRLTEIYQEAMPLWSP